MLQENAHEGFTEAHIVAMPIDEPGHRQLALKIEDPGISANEPIDLIVVAHGDDPVASGRQGRRLRAVWVHRDNLATDEYQISHFL